MDYSIIDNSIIGAIELAFTDPIKLFKAFFLNPDPNSSGIYIKAEFYIALLLSGGIIAFRKPIFLIVFLPLIAMKVLNDSNVKWGTTSQYSIEFAPLIGWMFIYWLRNEKRKVGIWMLAAITFLSIATTLYTFNNRKVLWYSKARGNPLSSKHWQQEFDVSKMHRLLDEMAPDEDVPVSAHYTLVPHLAVRDKVYQFPQVQDAEYLFIRLNPKYTYPVRSKDYQKEIDKYLKSDKWVVEYRDEYLLVLKKSTD